MIFGLIYERCIIPKFPFSELVIRHQYRFKNKGFLKKENTGIDTETYKGYTRLICDSFGNHKFIDSFEDILGFLTRNCFKEKMNWFFNIQFDFESMVKYLDRDTLFELYNEKRIEYNNFKIFYLPKKFFSIRAYNDYYYFYDINNFLETSLKKAGKKYLGKEKLNIIDARQLNISLEYWKKYEDLIIEYCLMDAEITKELSDYFWNLINNTLNFLPKRPFSKGRMSEEYFLSKCFIPTINEIPHYALNQAWSGFSGGRFEILKRGFFPKSISYDLKSAYPKIISTLIDFNQGKWENTEKYDKEADYGFYYCTVKSYNLEFSPFIVKMTSLNIYPNGIFKQYLNNFEIDFIRKNFPTCEIEVHKGVKFNVKKEVYPFKKEIEFLYEWKEKEKDADIKYAIKIIMNSFYGKMAQCVNKRTGKIWNPISANLITSLTRLKLLELGLQNPSQIIGFSTDCVHSIVKLKTPKHPKMGEFEKQFEGKGWYIMNDIYSLVNEEGRKDKFRGFTIVDEEDNKVKERTLEYILNELKGSDSLIYKYYKERPLHLGECLIHRKVKKVEDINIFKNEMKKINVNGDIKRIWERNFINVEDCLENNIKSLPIVM